MTDYYSKRLAEEGMARKNLKTVYFCLPDSNNIYYKLL